MTQPFALSLSKGERVRLAIHGGTSVRPSNPWAAIPGRPRSANPARKKIRNSVRSPEPPNLKYPHEPRCTSGYRRKAPCRYRRFGRQPSRALPLHPRKGPGTVWLFDKIDVLPAGLERARCGSFFSSKLLRLVSRDRSTAGPSLAHARVATLFLAIAVSVSATAVRTACSCSAICGSPAMACTRLRLCSRAAVLWRRLVRW